MLHQLVNIDHTRHFILACSGGSDSMAIADFYKRGKKNFQVAYFNHKTAQADEMEEVVRKWASDNQVGFLRGELQGEKGKKQSPEEFFRDERYKWFRSLADDSYYFVLAHHLNDQVEQWIFSSLHGSPRLMRPVGVHANIIIYRPFLTTTKCALRNWCIKHNVPWLEDKSNQDLHFPRNFIRHKLIEECLQVNPGLVNMIRRKILAGGFDATNNG